MQIRNPTQPASTDAAPSPAATHSGADSQHPGQPHSNAAAAPPESAAAATVYDHAADAADMERWHDVVHQDLITSTRVVRTPGDPTQANLGLAGDSFRANASGVAIGNLTDSGNQGSLTADRTSALARVSAPVGGNTVSSAVGLAGGALYAELAMQSAGGTKVTLNSIAHPTIGGGGVAMAHTVGNVAATAGLFAVASLDVSAEVKGIKEDLVRIDYKKFNLYGLQLTAGFTSGAFGVGARLFGTHAKEVRLSRWESKTHAAAVMAKQGFLQRKLQGLGVMAPVFKMPNYADPMRRLGRENNFLKLEDELTLITTHTITGGVAANLGGVYVGGHATVTGEHQLSIMRVTDDTMRVTLAPSSKASARGMSVDLPFLAAAQASVNRVSTSHSTYEFDLTHEAAVTAYKQMITGVVPGPVLRIDSDLAQQPAATLRRLNAMPLPSGVSLISLSYAATPVQLRAEAGVTGLKYLLASHVGGLSVKRISGRAQYIHATMNGVVQRQEWSHEWRTELLRPGATSTAAVMVQEKMHTNLDAAVSEDATVLHASRTIERPTPKQRQAAIKWLNEHMLIGTSVPLKLFADAPSTYSYGITVERALSREDLAALLRRNAIPGDSALRAAWRQAGDATEEQNQVLAQLTDKIAERIRRIGPTEVGRLHRILGDDAKLTIAINSDASKRLKQEADLAAVKYHKPLDLETATAKQLDRRVGRVNKLVNRIEEASKLVGSDPVAKKFTPDAIDDEVKEIKDILDTVLPLVDLTHLSDDKKDTLSRKLRSRSRDRLSEMNRGSGRGELAAEPVAQEVLT